MEQELRISVTLLNNRFHGEDWPSSPARLFRALVAGSMTGGYRGRWSEVEAALRWLEELPAPEILAIESRPGQPYRISVPNNDMDVAVREWRAERHFDTTQLRTMKQVKPLLFESDGPHIAYTWRSVEMDDVTLAGLRYAVHCLHTLGWGVDVAFAEIGVAARAPVESHRYWRPATSGEKLLPVPTEGSLEDLQKTYASFVNGLSGQGVDPDIRPSVYRMQAYESGVAHIETAVFELRRCEDEGAFAKYPQAAMEIAAWMRHAASQALMREGYTPDVVNASALGHSDRGPEASRLSYLPVPSIGHPNADGRIRRIIVRGSAGAAQGMVRSLARRLHGSSLTNEAGDEVCRLAIAENLKATTRYTRSGRRWETVTPIVLHGHNALRGEISIRKTERLLLQAFDRAGFGADSIVEMIFQRAPLWPNTGDARSYRVPAHLNGWPRYHVAVVFGTPVSGPVIAGLGRHYGIGTLACSD